jgi:hypothetical protein
MLARPSHERALAQHTTSPHEALPIRAGGLRLLYEQLVRDRTSNAVARSGLSHAARRHAETGNIYL